MAEAADSGEMSAIGFQRLRNWVVLAKAATITLGHPIKQACRAELMQLIALPPPHVNDAKDS